MSIKPFKMALPYFELLCFVAAWVLGLSVAWTATRDMKGQGTTARVAASNLQGPAEIR
ncbi:MAG: hypothetical protein JW829_12830 [Pirellulales bacterium]|nr:hypothetical protein [Pirellulales bacterium]